ncbi:MAG TPA: serine hydrolase [Chloroflexi bacterium]|nr:serine hydrolase [Chloroflexota bacterium]HHW86574.1 beta-lactamase family protein [Chloroflexota bacterium]
MYALDQQFMTIMQTPGADLSGLAVVVYVGGDIRYEGYFGQRFIDSYDPAGSLPVTAATKFRVASISKIVTALAIMQLVERGLLDLDADVSDVLGWSLRNPHWPKTAITTRMLLTHTSSLRDGEVYTFPPTTTLASVFQPGSPFYEDGAHFAGPTPHVDYAPGRFFSYCNLGFGVMGTLIERLTGERFDLYVDRHVLAPLGVDASFNVRNLTDDGLRNLAVLYRRQRDGGWDAMAPWAAQVDDLRGERPPALPGLDAYVVGSNGTVFSPQGGLRISALDLVEVMKVFLHSGQGRSGRVLEPTTVQQILTVQWRFDPALGNGDPYGGLMRAWGLGVQQLQNAPADSYGAGDCLLAQTSPKLWGHMGDAYGLLSAMFFDPTQDAGFVYIIGGVGRNPDDYRGEYSAFYRWEEQIQTAILTAFPM